MNKTKKILTNFLKNIAKIHYGNSVLIISSLGKGNNNGYEIGKAIFEVCEHIGCKVNLVVQTPRLFSKPMDHIVRNSMMENYDIVFQTDVDKLGHDPIGAATPYLIGKNKYTNILYYRKAKKEITAYWFDVSDIDKWLNSIDIDYEEMGKLSIDLEEKLKKTKYIRVISDGGKNQLKLKVDRTNFPRSDYSPKRSIKGAGGNIPFGETLITPDNSFATGSLVVDGSFYNELEENTVIVETPITLSFRNGKLSEIKGDKEAETLTHILKTVKKQTVRMAIKNKHITKNYLNNIYGINEFAIGTNKNATISGDLVIDEKTYGTAHIALGRSYDGDPAFLHCDLIVKKPKIIFEYYSGKSEIIVNENVILPTQT
ncbi:MAG TPA: hypothetical protein VG917_00440 [Patescibacteria group bacterium]|nr:hypothetical protein [Patescibacteria group bacterium]